MNRGDRVTLDGRLGTVVDFAPQGMVDVRFDDATWTERKPAGALSSAKAVGQGARRNPSRRGRKQHRGRWNPGGLPITQSAYNLYASYLADLERSLPEAVAELEATDPSKRHDPLGSEPDRWLWHKSPADKVQWLRKQILKTRGELTRPVVPDAKVGAQERILPDLPPLVPAQLRSKEREQQAAFRRTAGRPLKKQVEADLETMLPKVGAVMFTEPDPPRVSYDRTTYCGNPVDDVAYYIVLSEKRRPLYRYITKAEVAQFAASKGRDPKAVVEGRSWEDIAVAKEYIDGLEKPGTEVAEERVAARQLVRPRPGMGMPTELTIREKKVGPAGIEADPALHYFLVDEAGNRSFYRIYTSASPALQNLLRFQPYVRRQFTVGETSSLLAAIVAASKRDKDLAPRGIHPQTAMMLITSCAVSVDRVLQAPGNPNVVVEKGSTISIALWDKSKSPFFSWVRALAVPLRALNQDPEHCLSLDDMRVQKLLRTTRDVIGRFRGGLGAVRSLFRGLIEYGVPDATMLDTKLLNATVQLAGGYTAMWRWWNRLIENANRGDPAAFRAYDLFRQTVLDPEDEGSAFYRGLTQNIRSSENFAGLLGGDGWNEGVVPPKVQERPGLKAAYLVNTERRMKRKGYEFLVVSKELGTFKFRVPPSRVKPEVKNRETYDAFMARLLEMALAPEQPLDVEDRAATFVLPHRPGISALRFFVGAKFVPEAVGAAKGGLPHPMDDLYLYVQPSLHPDALPQLHAMRQLATGEGIYRMRWTQDGSKDVKAATEFRHLVGQYGVGGVKMAEGMMDPFDRRFAFELKPHPAWPVPFEQQLDMNWVIALIVDVIFPALMQSSGAEVAGQLSRNLLLLAMLYDMVGGFSLAGPLNPAAPVGAVTTRRALLQRQERLHTLQKQAAQAGTPERRRTYDELIKRELERKGEVAGPSAELLALAGQQIGEAEAEVLGGRKGLGGTGRYQAYRTYNPVLFEFTRLFWPSRGTGERGQVSFGSILAVPDKMADIDAVGRYGYAMQQTQGIAAQSRFEEEVSTKIGQALSSVFGQEYQRIMTGFHEAFAPFILNWPLGEPFQGAQDAATQWVTDPLAYLKNLKMRMELAITKVRHIRRVGLPGIKPDVAEVPFMYKDRPAIHPDSAVRPERSDEEAEMLTALGVIDQAIASLGQADKAKSNSRRVMR